MVKKNGAKQLKRQLNKGNSNPYLWAAVFTSDICALACWKRLPWTTVPEHIDAFCAFSLQMQETKNNLNRGKLYTHMQNKSFEITHTHTLTKTFTLKKNIFIHQPNPIDHVELSIRSFPLSEFVSEMFPIQFMKDTE